MTAAILDGKAMSKEIRAEVANQVAQFTQESGVSPCLAAVLVGDDPASQVYVRNKQKGCEKAGIKSQMHRPSADTSTAELLALIEQLNADKEVNGIGTIEPL